MINQILMMYIILAVAVILFITEIFRVDIASIIIMLMLAWSGILNVSDAFSGFSGNAVISVIAIMMMGYGIEKSGIMNDISGRIVGLADSNEKKLLVLICFSAGIVSSFMQNIGAVALFLPVVVSIAKRTEMPVSQMLMPLGFSTILGGNLTMIASGPLIILNYIVADFGYERFSFFSVTPVGAVLLFFGILYMNTMGK